MNKKIKTVAVSAAFTTMGFGGAAQAAMLTQTQTLNSTSNPTDTSFNGFNVAGGTLTAVNIAWDMSANLSTTAVACADFDDCATTMSWYFGGSTGAFEVVAGGLVNNILDTETQAIGFDLTTDAWQTRSNQMALGGSAPYVNFADFLGAGSIGSVQSLFSANGFPYDPDSVSLTGTISLTYTYDERQPPSVPEPATLALFGLGLAGIGAVRRRRAA